VGFRPAAFGGIARASGSSVRRLHGNIEASYR
jgi:hypothetical protein